MVNRSCVQMCQCVGDSAANRICRIKNLLVFDGKIYFVTDGENDSNPLPPLEYRLHQNASIESNNVFQFKRFEQSPLILWQDQIKDVKNIPKSVIWARNSAGAHIYHNTIDDSSLFYHHICRFYDYCDYNPQNRSDVFVIYSDGFTFEESASTKQVWSCFTPNYPIRPNNSSQVLYVVEEAILGVGEHCMHFYHCNPLFRPNQHSWFPWEIRNKWIGILRSCIMEDTTEDTNQQVEFKYQAPKERDNVITIINREKRFHRSFINVDDIVQKVRNRFKDYEVSLVYMENKTLKQQARDIFGKSKLILAMHGAALTNVLYMRNCSAVVSVFPYGHVPMPHNFFFEPYIFGNIGVAHHAQNMANIAFMSYHTEHMSQMSLDYEKLNRNLEFVNLTIAEREDFIVNGICPDRYSFMCLYYWLHRTADVLVNTTKLLEIVETAMDAADQCLGTQYRDENLMRDGRWMLADCAPTSRQDFEDWNNGKGRLISPSPESCCGGSVGCNPMYGWIIGFTLASFPENSAQTCCNACKQYKDCNTWNYCPCAQGCHGYAEKTCILKQAPQPQMPQNITQGFGLSWLGGSIAEGEIYPHWKCGYHKNGSLDCVENDCNTVQGLLKHGQLKNMKHIVFSPQFEGFNSVSAARCCEACKQTEGCNVWNFCNNPMGCQNHVKPFQCFLDRLPSNVSFAKLQIDYAGSFSSRVSGFVIRNHTHLISLDHQ